MPLILNQACAIRFEQVNFSYLHGQAVLTDLSFEVPAGKTIALVGHSGAGKSTIASLLTRFYEIDSGRIMLNDIPIDSLSLTSLRQAIAIVSQQVTLFNDTVAANIAYGRADISEEQIIHAAKLAYADEFIRALPKGYDTQIGEDGVLLSGGQRQRLAIARAILKDAPILILDEATSALDNESERFIQAALENVMRSRTTLVIAHRLSTIQHADCIVVLHKGRLVESGSHESLLQLGGYYSQFYQVQSQHTHDTLALV